MLFFKDSPDAQMNFTTAEQQALASISTKSFFLHVDTTSPVASAFTNFSDEVMARMSQWPFYCADCNQRQGV